MKDEVFINEALDIKLNKYYDIKKNNDYSNSSDFLVYVINILACIYGEENILSLYEKRDSVSFTYLLKKYNVDDYYVDKFYDDVNNFYKLEQDNTLHNPYFIYIQEDLINMYIAKCIDLKYDAKKINKFKELLFTNDSNDNFVSSYNRKMAEDPDYILEYFEAKVNLLINKLEFSLERNNILSDEVYEAFNLTKEKREKLSHKELENVNNKIFNYFDVSPIDINVNEKILNKIKKNKHNKINMKKITIFAIICLLLVIIILLIVLKLMGVL